MDYCARSDIEHFFGADNVAKWADLDNDQDETKIADRITKAITYAQAELDSRMMGGMYTVPFTTAHPVITELTAKLAAIGLYGPHGLIETTSEEGIDKMAPHRKFVRMTIKEILSGQRNINMPRACLSSGPVVIPQHEPRHPRHDPWMGRL